MLLKSDIKVLIVDDQDAMRNLHRFSLRQLGLTNTTDATNGADALKLLGERPFQLVICDWNMTPVNGLEVFKKMQADPTLKRIPFIMVTGNVAEQEVKTAISAGVRLYLGKPYTAAALKQRIEKGLGQTI